MGFAAVHQSRIDAERHVVQKETLVRVPDIAGSSPSCRTWV